MRLASLSVIALFAACSACSSGVSRNSDAPPGSAERGAAAARNGVPAGPSYEVHEWGLVRGTPDDHVMISGPRAEPQPMVMAKPVLYFHRDGAGPLVVEVGVRIPGGRVVEHWPATAGPVGDSVTWPNVRVGSGSCHGARYPTLAEAPCASLTDGCESATLATVETTDSDCLTWPAPMTGSEGQSWNHLFYRGETTAAPRLPLGLSVAEDGGLRVTASGAQPIPGQLIRIRRANGVAGATDAAVVVSPPAPGATTVVPVPNGPLTSARASLAASLSAAGLTRAEVDAFRRSWDDAIFGPSASASVTTTPPAQVTAETTTVARPMVPPRVTTALLYVLPTQSADVLARLTFSPAPRVVRRAIVIWMDEG